VRTSRPRVLLIDHASRRRRLDPALEAAGYEQVRADTARKGLAEIRRNPPDAVVLDLRLPDANGGEVLRQARRVYQGPIIVLSGRDADAESVEALEAGADDYLQKPFRVPELIRRLRVSLRRHFSRSAGGARLVRAAGLVIDPRRRLVTRNGRPIHLSPKEYELLMRLAEADGKVISHRQLLVGMWGQAHAGDAQYLRVLVGQLRQRIEIDPSKPSLVLTEPGVGYRFLVDGAAPA
jgi:two-component system, OmpR family, KDP operon response regulator KdpE